MHGKDEDRNRGVRGRVARDVRGLHTEPERPARNPCYETARPATLSSMKTVFCLIGLLLCASAVCDAAEGAVVRVLVWDEQQPEQKQAYGDRFLGETIAAHLGTRPGFSIKHAGLDAVEQGLDEATLNATDVIIWWGHKKHGVVKDEFVERIVSRVKSGKLALIALHSAHWSKPFVRLMQERAKTDALQEIPTAERSTARFEFVNDKPYGRTVKRDARLTPSF
jgi:hypothetical protein